MSSVVKTDSSRQADEDVCRHILSQAERGESAFPLTQEVLVCKAMMLDIKNRPPYRVKIPDLFQRVSFTDGRNRRNPSLFVDLVIGLACIRHHQRKKEQTKEGGWVLYANMEDIREAAKIFNAQGEYLGSRLGDEERAAAMFISESGNEGLSIKELAEKLRAKYPDDGWNEKKARRLMLGRQEKNGGMAGLAGKLPGLFTEDVPQLNEYGSNLGKPIKHFKFPKDVSKLDFFGLQVIVREPTDAEISNGMTQANSPESPAFPKEDGESQNDSSDHVVSASTPKSPDDELEKMTGEESKDIYLNAKSGEIRGFGEKARENEPIDRENGISSERGIGWGKDGELSQPLELQQVPSFKPESRLEANIRRLDEIKRIAIRRKMEAKKRVMSPIYPDASGSEQREDTPDGPEDKYPMEGLGSKQAGEGVASPEVKTAGNSLPIDKCKVWLMSNGSPEHLEHIEEGE